MPDSELPDGWRMARLGDLVQVNPDAWKPSPNGTIRYLDIASISGPGKIGTLPEIPSATAPSRARRKARPGDVLVSTVRPYLKAFARLSDVPDDLVISTGFAVLRPRKVADGEFVYQQVLTADFQRHVGPRMTGTGYPAVRPKDVADFPILVPPAEERARIADVLDAIDAAIEKTEAVIAATERLRAALLHELLTRGVPGWHTAWKDVPGIGTIPACWEVVRLGEVLERIEAGRSPACENRSAAPGEWGVLKVSAVSWEEFHSEENKALPDGLTPNPALEVRPGDLLVSRANTPELVGRSVLVETTRPRLLLCDKTLRLVPRRERTNGAFLRVLLATSASRRQIEGSATGTSRSMRNISQEALRSLAVPAPPLEEQMRITELTTGLRERCEMEKRLLDMLRLGKQIAASVLLSGRVRVPRVVGETPA